MAFLVTKLFAFRRKNKVKNLISTQPGGGGQTKPF